MPVPGAVDGTAPGTQRLLSAGGGPSGLERPVGAPEPGELLRRCVDLETEAGGVGGSQGRRLAHGRTHDRDAEHVGLKLHEKVVARGATVDLERRDAMAAVG